MPPVVDVHAHYVSPALIAEAGRRGGSYGVRLVNEADGTARLVLAEGRPLRPVSPELQDLSLRLPLLARHGVDRQILSTWTDLAGDELPASEAARWARLQNETLADAARTDPQRFEAMGTLPLQDIPLALEELRYISRRLGMRSVEMVTSLNGRDLDHPSFDPLWRALHEDDIFVLLHPPARPVGIERLGDYFLNNLLGFPMDTSVAGARLLFGGVLTRYPGLNVCLVHGGGFLPYQLGRLDLGFDVHPACKGIEERPSELIRRFYFDTLTHNTAALGYLAATAGSDRLLFGSDYPFEMFDPLGPQRLRDVPGLAPEAVAAILGGNAASLLPYAFQPLRAGPAL